MTVLPLGWSRGAYRPPMSDRETTSRRRRPHGRRIVFRRVRSGRQPVGAADRQTVVPLGWTTGAYARRPLGSAMG